MLEKYYFKKNVCFVCVCVCVCMLSHVWLFVTPCTVSFQAPLATEFSKQEYWSRLPFPSPRHLPNPGTEPTSFASLTMAGMLFTS